MENDTIGGRIATLINELAGGVNTQFAANIGVNEANLRGYIQRGIVPKCDVIEKIVKYYDIDANWLLTGEGSMLRSEEPQTKLVSFDQNVGKPYYDVDFCGGFQDVFNDQTIVPTSNIYVAGFDDATLWCNVYGHSMEPKINHGDIIALRECRIDSIQYGEIYAVVMDEIRTVKILRKSQDPDMLRFIPINKDFDEQDFPKSRIIRVFEVIGSIAKFF